MPKTNLKSFDFAVNRSYL